MSKRRSIREPQPFWWPGFPPGLSYVPMLDACHEALRVIYRAQYTEPVLRKWAKALGKEREFDRLSDRDLLRLESAAIKGSYAIGRHICRLDQYFIELLDGQSAGAA
jgi:hypothetical protein